MLVQFTLSLSVAGHRNQDRECSDSSKTDTEVYSLQSTDK